MKVFIFHASAGEGHRRAAIAVESALIRSGMQKEDILTADALDYGSPFFKSSYVGFYFWIVKNLPVLWGVFYHLLDHPAVYHFFYPIRRVYNAWHGQKLLKEVIETNPALVICTHFFSAEILGHAKKHGKIKSKILVLVTDFHPVRVWMHDGIDHYWVLSHDAKTTLIERGVAPEKITPGGFPITSDFQRCGAKDASLKKYGLAQNKLTLLLTTGSFGLGEQERLLDLLKSEKDKIQCLVVCGRNQTLQETLQKKNYPYPVKIFGFVDFMSEMMDIADLIVAKPGGATTAEAMAKGVPMIATGAIPGQETENLKFLLRNNAIFSAENPEQILKTVQTILENPSLLEGKRQACDRISNPRAAEDIAQLRLKWIS